MSQAFAKLREWFREQFTPFFTKLYLYLIHSTTPEGLVFLACMLLIFSIVVFGIIVQLFRQ